MSKEVVKGDSEVDSQTGWESVAEMAEGGAGKGMESLADEPSFGEHMAGKGGEKKTGGFFGGMREKLASMVHEEKVKRQEAKMLKVVSSFDGFQELDRLVEVGDFDITDERIADRYVDIVASLGYDFSEQQTRKLLNVGIPVERLARNEQVRNKTIEAFRKIVSDTIEEQNKEERSRVLKSVWMGLYSIFGNDPERVPSEEPVEYKSKIRNANLFEFGEMGSLDDEEFTYGGGSIPFPHGSKYFSLTVLEEMASTEEGQRQLSEGLDIKTFGDILVSDSLERFSRLSHMSELGKEKELSLAKRNLAILKKLGYHPSIESGDDGYFGLDVLMSVGPLKQDESYELQEYAQEIGLIDKQDVNEMYRFRKAALETYMRGESDWKPLDINPVLEFDDDEIRKIWERDQKYDVDSMGVIASRVRQIWMEDLEKIKNGEMEAYDFSELIDDWNVGEQFLNRVSVVNAAKYNVSQFRVSEYDGENELMRRLLVDNIEKVEELYINSGYGYVIGFLKTWDILDSDNNEEGEILKENFMGALNDGFDTIKCFDEKGVTETFYDKVLAYTGDRSFIELIDEDWKSHYSDAELGYIGFTQDGDYRPFSIISENGEYGDEREAINRLFDADGPNEILAEAVFEKNPGMMVSYPELLERLPNGNRRLADKLFSDGKFEIIEAHDELLMMSDKQKKVIEQFGEVDGRVKEVYKDVFKDGCEDYSIEGIERVGDLIGQLVASNADEIAGHPAEFARMLLVGFDGDEKDLMDRYEKVEEIFVHNNLPFVGKVFNTFSVVFMNEAWKEKHPGVMDRGDLGRVPEEQKSGVLWNDLLKASIGSGDKQLREYLESLREGSILAEKLLSEDVPENEFSDDEIGILNEYAEHLDTLYSNTERGKLEQETGAMSIFDKVRYYSLKFSAEERREIPDIIVRNFASGLGFQSLGQLLGYMKQTVESADAKNREAARRGEFRLESGDLIKAVETEYLGNMLQSGVVCKEFLNGEQNSDSTPLDADLGVVPDGMVGSISEVVQHKNDNNLFPAMHCMLVMKGDSNDGGRGRFKFESEEGGYDPWKYEVWKNSGENHGVRVGFPSTEIDYIVYDRVGSNNGDIYGDLERMKFEMVRSGFYIPVVDRYTEKVIFTPDEYDRMREGVMGGLKEYSDAPYRFADERGVVNGFSLPEYRIGETIIPSTTELVEGATRNREEVNEKRGAILGKVILPVLEEFGLRFDDEISSNLFKGRAEVIDTGSTGRYSNAPHDGDFDFMMKLDKEIKDGARLGEIRDALLDRMNLTPEQRADAVQNGNIRATDVKIEGLDELVDIDVTFARRTAKVAYSTDMALKEYYEAMRAQSPEKAAEVVANVVYAKKFLKANGVYKPRRRDENQGGLGGVGVENWVIQNGGSFEAAARSFMRMADECGDSFELFKEKYGVFDFGENHKMDAKAAHDNFVVGNMNAVGYGKMRAALREFLDMIDSSRS